MDSTPSPLLRLAIRGATLLVLIGVIGLLVFGIVKQAPDTTIDDQLARGEAKTAPELKLPVLQGGSPPSPLLSVWERVAADDVVSLAELRGTPIVLNFWASWCAPCRTEAPVLERGWKRAASKGVLFLGVDQQDVTQDARDFLSRFNVSYPNLREAGKETSRRFGATGFPETFFVSPSGAIAAHVVGAVDDELLRRGIAAAQSGVPVRLGAGGASETAP